MGGLRAARAVVVALASVLLVALIASTLEVAEGAPEQVHIQLTRWEDEMMVYWMTPLATSSSNVEYGTQWDNLDNLAWSHVQGQYAFKQEYVSGYFHKVILRKLQPGTRYYYRVGDSADGWSETFWFTTRQNDIDATIKIAALADQDMTEDSNNVLQGLLQQQMNFNYDMLLHAGDIVYADGAQSKWDDYGRWWQPFSAYYPVMYTIGENDVEGQATQAYSNRLRHGVTPTTESWNWGAYWYSFHYGPAHIIFLSSEHFSSATWITRDPQDQIDWLERNLKAANTPANRKVRPWIFVVLHRPLLNSPPEKLSQGPLDQELKTAFEELFHKYRVNVVISGHCHNYERTYPVYKEEVKELSRGWVGTPYTMDVYSKSAGSDNWGTIYTTVGTAGRPVENVRNRPSELEAPCIVKHTNGVETESFIERDAECSNGCFSKDWSVAMNADRGFGVFEANRTMLHFKYFSVNQDRVIDEFVVCAVPGCASAPYAPPAAWPVATDTDKIDEQHILPPPSPPLPPIAPPSPPSPPPLLEPEEAEPDMDQDGKIIGALPGEEGYEEQTPNDQQEPDSSPGQDGKSVEDAQDGAPVFDGTGGLYYAPAQEGQDNFVSRAEPSIGYAPPDGGVYSVTPQDQQAGQSTTNVAAELEKLRQSKVAAAAAAASSSSEGVPFGLIVGIVALCFACCLGVVAGVALAVLRRRALMESDHARATAGTNNMMAAPHPHHHRDDGELQPGNLDMGNIPATGFEGSPGWNHSYHYPSLKKQDMQELHLNRMGQPQKQDIGTYGSLYFNDGRGASGPCSPDMRI